MPPSPAAHERDQKRRSATPSAAERSPPAPALAPAPPSVPVPVPAPPPASSPSASSSAPAGASGPAPPPPRRPRPAATPPPETYEESGQLENLNENQLRALLDEAVTYKRPKDREGKSSLFKNLLYKAEQASEEELHLGFGLGGSLGINTGKRGRAKRSLTHFPHSGSLQDLAVAGSCPDGRLPRPHNRHRRPVPVSARSLHGGSLPANVDQQYCGTFLEDVRCSNSVGIKPRVSGNDYIATVKCINPPPLGEQTSTPDYMVLSVANNESDRIPSPPINHPVANSPQPAFISGYYGDDDDGTEMDYIRPQKNSHIPSYTSRTTLEIVSPSMTGDAVTDRNPNVLNLVDTNHGCITSPVISQPPPSSVLETKPLQLPSSYCAVRSVTGPTSLDGNGSNNSGASATFPVMPNLNVINILQSQSHQFQHDSDKKNFDENYNAVQNLNSITGTSQSNQKKSKRKKLYKNETQTLSQFIDGYRGDNKLDDIIKFIESDADNVKQHGKNQSKANTGININGKVASSRDNKSKDDNDNDKSNKKRSTERRKDKLETKLKRANSMEELSRRKFDDLTATKDSLTFRKSKKSPVFEANSIHHGKSNERRSWCNEESESYYKSDKNDSDEPSSLDITVSVSNSTVSSKQKKSKQSPSDADISIADCDSFYAFESSDFQTVTKKKKVRKRHSPTDEGRNRSNFYNHNIQTVRTTNGGRSVQERDTLYKRFGNGAHPSVSSPPSDKSNDSNDDLDSIHSLPADASAERFQASYADMARAAPPVSPPPIIPPVSRQHNFPDLIESCNYYTNDLSVQEKHFDISLENTKNLLLKENSTELDKKSSKSNSLDFGHQPDFNVHKSYIREQYPALETRQRMNNKISVKSKVDIKLNNSKICQEKQLDAISVSKNLDNKIKDDISLNDSISTNEDISCDKYVKTSENEVLVNDADSNKHNLNNKIDIVNKPPDVVLPLTEINQTFDSRPAVIIMNEEPNRLSNDIHNINGITFGFDINEQLINGGNNLESEISDSAEYSVSCSNPEISNSLSTPMYNSNIDFPAINEKPYRESADKPKIVSDDSKHSKKSSRQSFKESTKLPAKHSSPDFDSHDSPKSEESKCLPKEEENLSAGQVVETCVGKDKALRYLAPTATSKDIYNLDKIVHYVGMAWENIIKTSGDKIRYFSDQQ